MIYTVSARTVSTISAFRFLFVMSSDVETSLPKFYNQHKIVRGSSVRAGLAYSLGMTDRYCCPFGAVRPVTFQQRARLSDAVSAGIQLQTSGRSGAGDRQAGEIARGWKSASDPARCHGLREDLYYRQCNPRDRPTHARHLTQQDAGRAALLRVQTIFPA